jgi:hypothetical protein
MTLQGAELAIGRLHPEFAVRLEHAIREARSEGLAFAGVFSAYRPPAFGVGGFSDKFNSLHTYGLAVDMRGIGRPGSPEAQLWHHIAARNGVVCPYGPRDRAEWNHCQPTSVKMILAENPLRETVTSAGPSDVESMFDAGNPLIEDMASAADSLSRATPTPVRALERVAAKPARHAKGERVATKSAQQAKSTRVAAKSGQQAKTERTAAKSSEHAKLERVAAKSEQRAKPQRVAAKSAQHAKTQHVAAKSAERAKTRVAAKSGQRAKTERVAAKSAERAKTERAAAKPARDAKLGQRRGGGRPLGAEEAYQKPKSKRA